MFYLKIEFCLNFIIFFNIKYDVNELQKDLPFNGSNLIRYMVKINKTF